MRINKTCRLCDYAAEHGSWPKGFQGSHCPTCHRTWQGYKECHCADCHQQFSTETSYAKHRKRGTCMTPAELSQYVTDGGKRVFMQSDRVDGPIWVLYRETEVPT